jgi:hypothetical protein
LGTTEFNVLLFRESFLNRTVATATGAVVCWNTGSVLCCFLSARAVFETVAVLDDSLRAIERAIENEDLSALETVAYKRTFSTRNQQVTAARPELQATNVQTFVDKFCDRYGKNRTFRTVYALMSERCHPNSAGTISMFSEIDAVNGIVRFSDRQNTQWSFRVIYAIMNVLLAAELLFNKLDKIILKIKTIERNRHDSRVQDKLKELVEASRKEVNTE